ncbi:MAG TPA: hypothetical protein VFE24_14460 [Pirellulales bacterium]|nr:hypothetical protein [Pirellulales bacterium]
MGPLVALTFYSADLAAEPAPAAAAASHEHEATLPPLKLRGYGVLSATIHLPEKSDDASGSAIEVVCESNDKAALLQAKFLSDFSLLPGVTADLLKTNRGAVRILRVAGQGAVAALRQNDRVVNPSARVWLVAAVNDEALTKLIERALVATIDTMMSEADAQVPMYLDRWDRYGFRFYYAPWMRPRLANGRDDENYDPLGDFQYAKNAGRSGIVLWNRPDAVSSAEGITNNPNWDWALREAVAKKLSVGINFDIGEPRWIFNRYPAQVIQRAPQYVGTWYGLLNYGNPDILAWVSPQAQDVQLAQMQKVMRGVMPYADNITSWLEMHGELSHPPCDMLVDFGPDADRSFQAFLKTRYASLTAAAKTYFADEARPHDWNEIHAPEVADFYGWSPAAIDLQGRWRISYQVPRDASAAAPELDDRSWPELTAPGDQIIAHLPHQPAVLRRTIEVPAKWRTAHSQVWLYLWDLNDTRPRDKHFNDTLAYVNGQLIPEVRPRREEGHWAALDVSDAVQAGENKVALILPQGCLLYRVYFSAEPPREYPNLGPQMNQRWADFADWIAWTRAASVRRGAQAIRQIDPNRQIVFMSPVDYAAGVKQSCQDYGGLFHDTGAMAGFWTDLNVMQMSAAGLPTDCEPGGGAVDEPDFKRFMGRWITEGTQGVDYFIHIGDILWRPDIKAYFDRSQPLWHLIGKYHCPETSVALVNSDRVARLIGFPWGYDPNTALRAGHWQWRIADLLRANYTRDMLDESDFEPGSNAAKYRVIIDSNTTIIDPPLLAGIERYVRDGGIFVTYVQTGRHTSSEKDAWPISKLTGYAVTHIDSHDAQGNSTTRRNLRRAPGQEVFSGDWEHAGGGNGLSLTPQAADCQDLLLWEDGSVAAGMRKLGRGAIIQLGVKFVGDVGNGGPTGRMFEEILRWAKIPRTPATAENIQMSHFISNNGLYDVWALFNERATAVNTEIDFRDGSHPESFTEINSAAPRPMPLATGEKIADLKFAPWETRVFLTPHQQLAAAPLQWLKLQRSWWRGTADAGPPVPPLEQKLALDLTDDWALQILDPKAELAPLIKPDFNDAKWERSPLRIVSVAEHAGATRAIFRKRFRVPENWKAGAVKFWCQIEGHQSFHDAGRFFIDGREAWSGRGDGPAELEFDGILRPGSEHTLAIEVRGQHPLVGVVAGAWLAYVPDPLDSFSLAGDWATGDDPLRLKTVVHLPGAAPAMFMQRTARVPARPGDWNVVLHVLTDELNVRGVLVNGKWIQRSNPYMGKAADFNITPYLKPGEDNQFRIVNARPGQIRELSLRYYERGQYP